MSILIVVPTVTGRERMLEACMCAYEDTTYSKGRDVAIFRVENKSTCGEGWNMGAKKARELGYEYVHMTADDLIPHAGWYETAVETVAIQKFLPCAKVFNPDGTVQVQGGWHHEFGDWEETGGGSVPFCRTEDWIDIPNIHYWSDNAYDYAQNYINKKKFVARTNYAFTHHTAQVGRKEMSDVEKEIYEEWKRSL